MLEVTKPPGYFPNWKIPIGIDCIDSQDATPMHCHDDFTELVIVTGGSGTHKVMDNAHQIQRRDVFIIHPNTHHSYTDVNQLSLINVLYYLPENIPLFDKLSIHPGYQEFFLQESNSVENRVSSDKLQVTNDELKEIISLCLQLRKSLRKKLESESIVAIINFLQIISLLCTAYCRPSVNKEILSQIGQIISFIEKNPEKEITLKELAKMANMSLRTFQRHFQNATGMAPLKFITEQRLSQASQMLEQENMNITEIAYKVGYKDSSYFTRIFKKKYGLNPTEYKRTVHG